MWRLVNPVAEGYVEAIVTVVCTEEASLKGVSPSFPAVCIRFTCCWPVSSYGGSSVGEGKALWLYKSAVACGDISE
jgi:hypothetical protein